LASAKEIPPGGEGKIDVTFKTKGRRGANNKKITVSSNDPAEPQVQLTVKAELEIALEITPPVVSFGTVPRGKSRTESVKLIGRDAANAKVTSVTVVMALAGGVPNTTNSQVLLAKPGEGTQAGSVEISLVPDAVAGRFDGRLSIKTDHPDVPELPLRVVGIVQGSVAYQPERLLFRDLEEGSEQTQSLTVTSTNGEPVEVLEVEIDHPALSASITDEDASGIRVTVTHNGDAQLNRGVATLLIRTSSTADPRISVPVDLYPMRSRAARPVRPRSTP
jgi:hypothetical protein